jgi:hypothetical protein
MCATRKGADFDSLSNLGMHAHPDCDARSPGGGVSAPTGVAEILERQKAWERRGRKSRRATREVVSAAALPELALLNQLKLFLGLANVQLQLRRDAPASPPREEPKTDEER